MNQWIPPLKETCGKLLAQLKAELCDVKHGARAMAETAMETIDEILHPVDMNTPDPFYNPRWVPLLEFSGTDVHAKGKVGVYMTSGNTLMLATTVRMVEMIKEYPGLIPPEEIDDPGLCEQALEIMTVTSEDADWVGTTYQEMATFVDALRKGQWLPRKGVDRDICRAISGFKLVPPYICESPEAMAQREAAGEFPSQFQKRRTFRDAIEERKKREEQRKKVEETAAAMTAAPPLVVQQQYPAPTP
jgi:hypothetical protein